MSCFPGNTCTILVRNHSDPKGIRCVTEVVNTYTNNDSIPATPETPLYKTTHNTSRPRPPGRSSPAGRDSMGQSEASGVTPRVAGVTLSIHVS